MSLPLGQRKTRLIEKSTQAASLQRQGMETNFLLFTHKKRGNCMPSTLKRKEKKHINKLLFLGIGWKEPGFPF